MPTHKLYFENRLIGEVEYSSADFPSFCGKFSLLLKQSDDLSKHILSYIDFSERQDRYYTLDGVVASDTRESALKELQQEEAQYEDLIETNSWTLVEEDGEVTKVLIPLFSFDGTITWRLNTAN